MTLRTRLADLALALSPLCAHADPQAQIAGTAASTAVSNALAREDAAFQRAIDRKIDARLAATLAPPLPARAHGSAVAARTPAPAGLARRPLYAVK